MFLHVIITIYITPILFLSDAFPVCLFSYLYFFYKILLRIKKHYIDISLFSDIILFFFFSGLRRVFFFPSTFFLC